MDNRVVFFLFTSRTHSNPDEFSVRDSGKGDSELNDNSSDIKKALFGMIAKQEDKFTHVTLKFLLSKS